MSGPTAALFGQSIGCGAALASLRSSVADSIARFGTTIRAARAQRHADTTMRVRIRDGWANINEAGDWNSAHTHGSSHVSGVVYVDAGNSTDGRSCTLLQNPAPGFVRTFSSISTSTRGSADAASGTGNGSGEDDICVSPEPGSVLLFPGWLPHAVLPHDGNMPRLSISFNADFVYSTGESGSGAARTKEDDSADSTSTFGQFTVGKDASTLFFNEASTDQEWLAGAHNVRSKGDGNTTAWLRHAWPSDVIVWSLSRLLQSGAEGGDAVFFELALGQKPPPLSHSITATIHELVCLLTARYFQVLTRRSGADIDTELEPCEAWGFSYDVLRMSAGARIYLPSSTSAAADDSNCGVRASRGDGSDGQLATQICGVVRLDVAPPHAVKLQGGEREQFRQHEQVPLVQTPRLRGDVTVGSLDPRPEYGFELNATDGDTRLLHSLGLETRSARESWNEQVIDVRPSHKVRLGYGEAAVLPCDAWVSSESTEPIVVLTFVASR